MALPTQNQLGQNNFRAAIITALSHPKACLTALTSPTNLTAFVGTQAQSVAGMPLNVTIDSGSTVIVSPNPAVVPTPSPRPLMSYQIAYEYLTLAKASNPPTADPNIAGNSLYRGTVYIQLDTLPPMGSIAPPVRLPLEAVGGLILSISPTNSISACQATTDTANDECTLFGGTQNPNPPATCKKDLSLFKRYFIRRQRSDDRNPSMRAFHSHRVREDKA